MVEGFDVEEGGREAGPGGFGVVEGNDEDGVGVGEGAVPGVVVGGGAGGEGAAVDCEECGEESGRGEVVVGGEENAVVASMIFSTSVSLEVEGRGWRLTELADDAARSMP